MFTQPPVIPVPEGRVTLVGAGPGDPDLLTLKAAQAIASATVILVDDLVNEAVLTHARHDARIIHVGKRGGCASTPQAFIEKLMIQQALAGEVVVRVKGGDPFIFGRGGEEVEHLQSAGVKVQVINGITAGLAAVTSLHAPLTHREHAHGVVFVTGHAKPGDPGTDWEALARCAHQARLTLVIYMGVSSATRIQEGLLKGLPSDTPVAIIQHASLPQQRHALGKLDNLVQTLQAHDLGSPSVIVVGDVLKGLVATQNPSLAEAATEWRSAA
jgi:uroporphyrin-III C-methyltransferase